MAIYSLADRLHKLPGEIMTLTGEELTLFMAYARIEARERKKATSK